MSPILMYLLKAALYSGLLFAYYCVALRNQRQHRWNRAYLLTLTAASLQLPLVRIPLPGDAAASSAILRYTAAAFEVNGGGASGNAGSWQWAWIAYALVAATLLSRFGYAIWQLRNLIRGGRRQVSSTYQLILHPSVSSPFSFFRYIFWNPGTETLSAEGRHMLQHEQAHIRKGHSWDTLFMETVTALCWINPFFHLVKKELSIVHEFEADEVPAGNGQTAAYAENLLRQALHAPSAQLLIHHFSQPPVKRRIMMLTRHSKTRHAAIRKLMALPLAAGILFATSCTQQDPAAPVAETPSPAPEAVQSAPTASNEIFTLVEQPPSFIGGDEALNVYLGDNIRYPKEAIDKDTKGTIFVQFVVRADGSISDVKTVGKVIGSGLEQESIRVVKNMPKWKAGKQNGKFVNVQFVLPIRFVLE
ncbi:M56 family metallopeptidase [Chitinophaga pollutisoli]|uniref:M56 family metallopeptidase n=1 Tax=Chitinophaga pollutisoli TaxID=3133966 RepID=A0ABZ2YU42_9BACT